MAHIGIDARLTQYRIGGISSYTLALLSALAEIPSDHRFTAFIGRDKHTKHETSIVAKHLLTPPHHRLERLSLAFELLPYRLDVFHATDFIPPQFGANHHIATIHDLTFLHFPEHKDRASQRYYVDQIDYAVKHAAHLLAVSDATKTDLITMLNVPEEKITVQPHGVEPHFKPVTETQKAVKRQSLRLPENYILFVGTLEPRKNLSCLLDAYLQLPEMIRDNFTLLLVGQIGWLFDETQQRIHTLQAKGEKIQIRHDVTNYDLPTVYALADTLVLPSHYEGFGMPLLEAMACGTPVIGADNSSLPQVIGHAGLLFESDNAPALAEKIEFALTNTAWREQAITAGLAQAAKFTWEQSAEIALSIYTQVSE